MTRTIPILLTISPIDPRSITRQITDGIRLEIASGQLPVGAQLPSVRGLALQLTINPKNRRLSGNEVEIRSLSLDRLPKKVCEFWRW